MTDDPRADAAPRLSPGDAAVIDDLCDAFEQAWRRGEQPRIAAYLGSVEEPLRTRLFEELLLSDLEFRSRDETALDTQTYVSDFPDRVDQVRAAIHRFSLETPRWQAPATIRGADPTSVDTSEIRPGTSTCGKYELLEEIARGGMGVVFKAHDPRLHRTVALKMILDRNLASQDAVQRFYAEAEMAASLNHPGIVPIYDVGSHAGQHYYAMGFVAGPSLSKELQRRRFGLHESARLVRELALAVHFAHQHGVVHRDLKPGNVLLTEDGQPQITDFGLAKRTDRTDQLTVAGLVFGTPGYMAPEQAAGATDQIGPAVDVYALGAVLYHLITGHPPFRTALDALACVLEQDPVPPRAMNRRVPRDLNVICMKCLSKNPPDRYRSARELADDLERYVQGDVIQAKPLSWRRRALRWARHRPRLAAVLLTMAAFYVYHLACLALGNPGSQGRFHALATGTTVLVCAYGWWFQSRMMRPQASRSLRLWWITTDIVVLTLFLMVAAEGAQSPLVVIYPCMVASAALSFDRHLVWLVTAASVLAYELVVITSLVFRSDLTMPPIHATVPVAISIAAIGLVQYFVLRCSRVQTAPP